jgi:DNA-binding GntR family transcriptional regulator
VICVNRTEQHVSRRLRRHDASAWRRPGVPKYQQLAELIRQRILDGTYLTGKQIPPEVTLMQESGYSRDTVRAAMKVLRETGWVTVTHGLGTFVNPPEMRTDDASAS